MSGMRRVWAFALLATTAIVLAGCPVPIFEAPPFKEKLPLIEEGKMSRADVLMALGEPVLTRGKDDVFAYTGRQLQMAFVAVAGGPGGVAAAALTLGEYHLLVVEFDSDGIVAHAEVIETPFFGGGGTDFHDGSYGERPAAGEVCTSTDVCFNLRAITRGS